MGPHAKTKTLIDELHAVIVAEGIPLTLDELAVRAGQTRGRVQGALQWATRGLEPEIEKIEPCSAHRHALYAVR